MYKDCPCKQPPMDHNNVIRPYGFKPFPVDGPIKSNVFVLNGDHPYLVDHTGFEYGGEFNVADNAETVVYRTRDLSCVNLHAKFNMLRQPIQNEVAARHLESRISNQYEELQEHLDILSMGTTFIADYEVRDMHGNIVKRGTKRVISNRCRMHRTDIPGYYMTSYNDIITVELEGLTTNRQYTFVLNHVRADKKAMHTLDYIETPGMNPYYQFSDSNQHIKVCNEMIQPIVVNSGTFVPIGCTDVHYAEEFTAGINTRVRINFVAYVDGMIFEKDTYNIWKGLFSSDEIVIAAMKRHMDEMQNEIDTLNQIIASKGMNAYKMMRCIDDYLFEAVYANVDYQYAEEWFRDKYSGMGGACSSIRYNNILGRNMDWYYDEKAYVVFKMEKCDTAKYTSIGMGGGLINNDEMKKATYNELYKVLPFMMIDGVNECGLSISTNVVPSGDKGITTGTIPRIAKRLRLCGLQVPRYILDNFSSAHEAIEYIKDYVSVYMPHNERIDEEVHFIIADEDKTYIVEFVNNELVDIEIEVGEGEYIGRPYMTNFYVDGMEVDDETYVVDTTSITPYSMGVERYNFITEKFDEINGAVEHEFDDATLIKNILDGVQYTKAYKGDTDPIWYSEFTSPKYGLVVTDPPEKFTTILTAAREAYANRSRKTGVTWQTAYRAVYDISSKSLDVVVQEGLTGRQKEYTFEL